MNLTFFFTFFFTFFLPFPKFKKFWWHPVLGLGGVSGHNWVKQKSKRSNEVKKSQKSIKKVKIFKNLKMLKNDPSSSKIVKIKSKKGQNWVKNVPVNMSTSLIRHFSPVPNQICLLWSKIYPVNMSRNPVNASQNWLNTSKIVVFQSFVVDLCENWELSKTFKSSMCVYDSIQYTWKCFKSYVMIKIWHL